MAIKNTMITKEISRKYPPESENLLLILIELQDSSEDNSITDTNMRWVAEYLNIPLSSVYGVVHYYSLLSSTPRGQRVVRICRSPVCSLLEGRKILEKLQKILDISDGEVTADGRFSVEAVECLGQCEKAPAMMIDAEVYGHIDTTKIVKIIENLRTEKP